MKIGAHIQRQKTLLDTIKKIEDNDGNSLQIFASNPKTIYVNKLNLDFFANIEETKLYMNKNKFNLVIHAPYTINLAAPQINNKREIDFDDCYWVKVILNDLKNANLIGALGCVVHCGKFTKQSKEDGLENMKKCIIYIIKQIIKNKYNSILILETSTGQGTELLYNYEEFLDFYNSFSKEYKKYFKLCIDTCHVWNAGYELNDIYNITKQNDNFRDIAVIHINNSKNPKFSKLDRHDMISSGYIKLSDLILFVKDFCKENSEIIFILETPNEEILKFEINEFTNLFR